MEPQTPQQTPKPVVYVDSELATQSGTRNALLCRYQSKVCNNLRCEKRGGGLHRYCAFHRERAIIIQRRVDQRIRMRRQSGQGSPPRNRDREATSTDEDEASHIYQLEPLDPNAYDGDIDFTSLSATLSEDDLRVLIELLDEGNSP